PADEPLFLQKLQSLCGSRGPQAKFFFNFLLINIPVNALHQDIIQNIPLSPADSDGFLYLERTAPETVGNPVNHFSCFHEMNSLLFLNTSVPKYIKTVLGNVN